MQIDICFASLIIRWGGKELWIILTNRCFYLSVQCLLLGSYSRKWIIRRKVRPPICFRCIKFMQTLWLFRAGNRNLWENKHRLTWGMCFVIVIMILLRETGLCINCISDPGRLERDPCYSGMMICIMTHCGPMQIVNNENLLDNVPRLQSFLANQRQTFIDMH